jgi:hypothetical protein
VTPSFDDDQSLASALFYMSFVTLTSTGYGDIVPLSSVKYPEAIDWQ